MADPHRKYEIRCPVHGFIELNDWEREIIDQPAFQRLRRIRQLGWTDQVYPGAMHTRFEHSLGVMHTATLLYDAIVQRSASFLERELAYKEEGLKRDRALVRLAALLHDVGHGPFSHAAEELMPLRGETGQRFRHEHYSSAIIRRYLRDVIENHPLNTVNYKLKADEVAAVLEGSAVRNAVFWRELIVGQMDADRMDYLIRDSLHSGVQYGQFDRERLLHTVVAIPGDGGQGPRLGVREGGWHAAEGLILARYFMFTQVYFHKTRVAFDHHLREALRVLLPDGHFPTPDDESIEEYLRWDDCRVLGALAEDKAGEHGKRLATRDHFREVYHTPEAPQKPDLRQLDRVRQALGDLVATEESASRSWYKFEAEDIRVMAETAEESVRSLSKYSSVVANLRPNAQLLVYVRPEHRQEAHRRVGRVLEKRK